MPQGRATAGVQTPRQTEAQFQRAVERLAHSLRWATYHTWYSLRSTAGFPDLVLVRNGRLIFAELKSARGKVTEQQQQWLDALHQTHCEVYLWRPEDMRKITELLR